MNKRLVLIGFHNEKALGVRYLATAARAHGYEPSVVFFKGFNSAAPDPATETELSLLADFVRRKAPLMVGLSAMSSLYIETLIKANAAVRSVTTAPVFWGGVLATLEPALAAHHADYVMRGEGERTLIEVLERLERGESLDSVENLAWLDENAVLRMNPIRPPEQDLDQYGYPPIGGPDMYLIDRGRLIPGDPQTRAFTYELCASRGCPFSCSYCSSINLRRLYTGKGKYVRFRSVDSVLSELREAKAKLPKLRVVHFWDEVFSSDPDWVAEFSRRYPSEIGLPFRIWAHPLLVREDVMTQLVKAGLYQVVMGIQSGSVRVRREIFHRQETQEQILSAARILSDCKVPHVIYDFMLCHPFETEADRRETFELCLQLKPPFELNIHGLNFLPATDIVQMAIDAGHYTPEQLHGMMYSSLQEQYDRYWGPAASDYANASADDLWIALICLTQFPELRPQLAALAQRAGQPGTARAVLALRDRKLHSQRLTHLMNKVKLVLKMK